MCFSSCNGTIPTLENGEKNKVYSSQQVEIEEVEIANDAEFEIVFEEEC